MRQYKRVFFGINWSSELFQNAIAQVIDGIPGERNISDDIIVFGSTQCEHDRSLELVLRRLSERNLTVNQAKCAFNKTSIEYFGHVFSAKGISVLQRRLKLYIKQVLLQMPAKCAACWVLQPTRLASYQTLQRSHRLFAK